MVEMNRWKLFTALLIISLNSAVFGNRGESKGLFFSKNPSVELGELWIFEDRFVRVRLNLPKACESKASQERALRSFQATRIRMMQDGKRIPSGHLNQETIERVGSYFAKLSRELPLEKSIWIPEGGVFQLDHGEKLEEVRLELEMVPMRSRKLSCFGDLLPDSTQKHSVNLQFKEGSWIYQLQNLEEQELPLATEEGFFE